ncbi:LppP/LprE family lipoprotein [Mycobacterium camsae]|uniref:LppP/LprE family lipoprotein n=1 Tax=Mycobacterium gordonae TaxID=1778 RepID=UPI00197D8DB5|nr:LppP/LprE family lipoprotein [Mycobacterium gordonae]
MVAEQVDPDWPPPAYDPSDDLDTTRPGAERPTPRRAVWLVAALAALVCLSAVAVFAFGGDDRGARKATSAPSSNPGASSAPSTGNAPPTACGPDEATALSAALGQVPPDRKTGKPWDRKASSGNYNACADLSAIVVTVQDGTNSSPDLALMFHRGAFVGTATPRAYPFTELEAPASTNDIVVLTYRTQQSCSTCTDGTLTTVGFQWQGDKVQMLDWPPESLDSPP